jgi:hypothetical protein
VNTLLPWLYDHVEPVARRIAERAATLEPRGGGRQWLAALRGAGYSLPCAQTWRDGGREFGGVYTARA